MNLSEYELIKEGYAKKLDGSYVLQTTHKTIIVVLHGNGNRHYTLHSVAGRTSRNPREGPAYECFHQSGGLAARQYLYKGNFHRKPTDGPAIESFGLDGRLLRLEYWLNGRCLSQEDLTSYGVFRTIVLS